MKRLMFASVGLTILAATSALASDMPPSRMPPPRAPAYVPFFSWNGFYVGINGGYGFGKSKWTDNVTGVSTGNFDITGGLVGGTLGYNVQTGSTVFGVETDIDWSDIKGSTTTSCLGSCQTSNTWLGTARGRIGYAFDRFLPYVTGGGAYGAIKGEVPGFGSATKTAIGWTAGAGIEYAFISNWSAKVEYLYVDLGKVTCDASCSGGNPLDVTFTSNIVRAGVNYKF